MIFAIYFRFEVFFTTIKDLVTIRDVIESFEEGQRTVVYDLKVVETLPKEITEWNNDSASYIVVPTTNSTLHEPLIVLTLIYDRLLL